MNYFLNNLFTICDAPRAWGVYFQDSASPQMEALVELHDNIMFYLVIVLFGVGWILISIIRNYVSSKSPISNKYLNHGTLIELIWTITPALILILIAFPSFKLLYLMDEVTDPSLTVFVEGHQWYWSYQYPDFLNEDDEELEFDSYLVPESDLEDGALRMSQPSSSTFRELTAIQEESSNNSPFNWKDFAHSIRIRCYDILDDRFLQENKQRTGSQIVTLEQLGFSQKHPDFVHLVEFSKTYEGTDKSVKSFCAKVIMTSSQNKDKIASDIGIYSGAIHHHSIGEKIILAISKK